MVENLPEVAFGEVEDEFAKSLREAAEAPVPDQEETPSMQKSELTLRSLMFKAGRVPFAARTSSYAAGIQEMESSGSCAAGRVVGC